MNLKVKMAFVIICWVAGIIVYGALSWNTLSTIKINGYYYQKISLDKELIADILPPPEYIIESYCVTHQMLETSDDASLKKLIHEFNRLSKEYQERHDYWNNTLPESQMKEELVVKSYKPAKEFLETVDKELIPALLDGDREKAGNLERSILTPKYMEHRQAIDRVVTMAQDALKKQESAAQQFIKSRTVWLFMVGVGIIFMILVVGFVWRRVEIRLLQENAEAIKESERRFQDIAENTQEWVWEVDAEGKYTYTSTIVEKLIGYKPEEILDKHFYDLFIPEEREENKEKAFAVFAAKQPFREFVNRNLHKDGSIVWLSTSGVPILDKIGNLSGYRGADINITARQKAEEELREAEQRFRAMFEKAADAILLADINNNKFLMGNEMASKMLGYSLDEIRQLGVMDIHPPEALPHVQEQFERQVKQEIAVAQDLPVKRKDGSVFYADVNAFPVIFEGESFLMGVFQDITARRQAVQALRETNAKLEIMVSEANRRNYETTLITGMSESLQSCLNFDEAYAIIAHTAQQLFPAVSGGLFMLEPAGNFLELVAAWGETLAGEQVFAPNNCWAIRRGRIYFSGCPGQNERCRHLPDKAEGCYFCLPLMAQEGAFGLLQLQVPGEVDSAVLDRMKDLVVTLGDNVSLALGNLKLRETLHQQVIHDPLTGLFNRRYLNETLEREVHRVQRKGATLGVIMMDLDNFKHFNDTFGHEAGDSLLETLGKFLKTQVRVEDIACRYGGEEFVLIMPEASLDTVQQRAEEIRREVPHLQVVNRGRPLENTTISLGVAIFPDHGATGQDVVRAADDAMYKAKAAGRDRVMVADGGA